MYPQIPNQETLAGMTAAELRALAAEIRDARREAATANPQMDAEAFDEWEAAGRAMSVIVALAADAAIAEQEAADAAAAEAAAQAEAEAAAEEAEEAATEVSTDDEDEDEGEHSTLPTGMSLTPASVGGQTPSSLWVATGVGDVQSGHQFGSTAEIAEVIQDVMRSMAAGDNDKRTIATLKSQMPQDRILDQNRLFTDLANLTDPDDEVMAAFCTPLQPLYALNCANVTRRPVFNGLPQFQPDADRGGFRVPESPSFFDVTDGWGQWTSADDSDSEALKSCAEIACVNWNDFEWYATYRCLKVKNLLQMTFPELVDAYLNRLQAQWARYSEQLLLEAMGTASTNVQGFAQKYGANVSLHRNILSYLGKFAEIERWDTPTMDAWMPRWLLWALRMDMASRRRDGGYLAASEETVNAAFREIGVEPHWFMDRPTWATTISPLAVNGDLTHFPSQVEILLHRRGKFAVMDKGELSLGLGGNPIRTDDDVTRNQATFFFESFEGLIDTDSCPAHLLTVPGLCYNGNQIADTQIECEGYDLVGHGSS